MSCIQKEVNNEKLSFEIIDNPTIEDLKCCICLELADNPQVTIECNHFFCKTCIEQYFGHESLKDCPLCKTRISRSGLKHFFLVETLISKMLNVLNKIVLIYFQSIISIIILTSSLQIFINYFLV
jgi:uncharacterized membrane protein